MATADFAGGTVMMLMVFLGVMLRDNAVDIAKESADMILLEKSLMVPEEGVLEGRKVFVDILKYIRMGASSNFANMFSVIGASAWFPFVPMAPIQVLTNNLLYDFSQVPIPTDNVGPTQIARPKPWNMGEIAKFIICVGPISSIFDYTTYCLMWFYFKCSDLGLTAPAFLAWRFPHTPEPHATYAAALFHAGWFVESWRGSAPGSLRRSLVVRCKCWCVRHTPRRWIILRLKYGKR